MGYYTPLPIFQHLNVFLREEAIPQVNDNIRIKAHLVDVPEDGLQFTVLTIMEFGIEEQTVPDSLVPLLTALYQQVYNLLTMDVYELNKFIVPYIHEEGLIFDSESMINNVGSSLYLYSNQQYDNVYDYNEHQGSTNLTDKLISFSLHEQSINRIVQVPIFKTKSHSLTGQPIRVQVGFENRKIYTKLESVMSEFYSKKANLEPTQTQKLSLLRLIWAVESINKIKHSISTGQKSYIFLDNRDFQVRMMMNPIYSTRLNLDQFALFQQSPFYSTLKDCKFSVVREYLVDEKEQFRAKYYLIESHGAEIWSRRMSYQIEQESDLVEMFFLPNKVFLN
jgi:hypothetical protein